MEAAIYLLLGLAVAGALIYAMMQVNARQQRLHAELTRLERLSAEVTMNAEAVLEQVDQRIERLNQLAAALEARAQYTAEPAAEAEAPTHPARTRKRSQGQRAAKVSGNRESKQATAAGEEMAQAAQPEVQPEPGPQAEPPSSKDPADRYTDRRQAVFALADQGKSPLEIAEALAIPRGEVQLMLNLRGRKLSPS